MPAFPAEPLTDRRGAGSPRCALFRVPGWAALERRSSSSASLLPFDRFLGQERREKRWIEIRLQQPDFPVVEVFQKRPVLLRTHFPSPYDFRAVDIGLVEYPLVFAIVP